MKTTIDNKQRPIFMQWIILQRLKPFIVERRNDLSVFNRRWLLVNGQARGWLFEKYTDVICFTNYSAGAKNGLCIHFRASNDYTVYSYRNDYLHGKTIYVIPISQI